MTKSGIIHLSTVVFVACISIYVFTSYVVSLHTIPTPNTRQESATLVVPILLWS